MALHVGERTIARYVQKGVLTGVRVGKRVLILESSIRALLTERS